MIRPPFGSIFYIKSIFYVIFAVLIRIPLGRRVRSAKFFSGISRFPFRPVALTCAGRTDGGGAQVQSVMSVIAFCKSFGYQYVHTPFRQLEHASGASELAAWEGLFDLGSGEKLASEFGYPVIPFSDYVKSPRHWFQKTVVAVAETHAFLDSCPEAYLTVRDQLRRKYTGSLTRMSADRLTIAAHIRRGDVTRATSPDRFTDNSVIAERIRRIHDYCTGAGLGFRTMIYSQGAENDFEELRELGCELCLDQTPLASLRGLVQADVLLTAKSSFSYVAGLLSNGLVVYEPFWHSPLPDWLSTEHLEKFGPRLSEYLSRIGSSSV